MARRVEMRLYERAVWPLLRRLEPETSHTLTLRGLAVAQQVAPLRGLAARLGTVRDPRLEFTWRGLTFRNPVGIAAGSDKDGRAPLMMAALGFGFVEVGTVTLQPQPGNRRPRVFRVPERGALINSLGFPSEGAARMVSRLRRVRLAVPLGVNIGKNAATPLEEAARDYLGCLEALYPYGDYFAINVSSPNTAGLTSLQAKPALRSLASALVAKRAELAERLEMGLKPLLVKLSPDLTATELDDVLEVAVDQGVEGVIAVNTSGALAVKGDASVAGGISGQPLRERALEVVSYIRQHGPRDFFVVGVGGVFHHRDAWALLKAGANAVQLYTGLAYRGPWLAKSINRGLLSLLEEAKVPSLQALTAQAGAVEALPRDSRCINRRR